MKKFYVTCGTLERMVLATHAEAAAVQVFKNCGNQSELDQSVYVSEQGHLRHPNDEEFDTSFIMSMAGLVFED